jgi:proteasome lid subunit RPN8/RPN11
LENRCASVIVAHNHPSGVLSPSYEDIQITKQLKQSAELLGIELLDHIIINNGNIEVGKKIGKKTTVIYIDGEIPTVKVKYEHTSHLESVVSANEQSQSYDIVYKNDYEKASDIVLIGK